MKKFFSLLAFATFAGSMFGADLTVPVTFTGVNDAYTHVNVIEIKDVINNPTEEKWQPQSSEVKLLIANNTQTELIINPTGDYYLTASIDPMQNLGSGVKINEINSSNVSNFADKGAVEGGVFIILYNNNLGTIINGSKLTVTVNSGNRPGEVEKVYPLIPVNFKLPENAPGLVQSLKWLQQTTEIPENQSPDGYSVQFTRYTTGNNTLYINYRTDEEGKPIYNVGKIEAYYYTSGSGKPQLAIASNQGNGGTVVIPEAATEVEIYISLATENEFITYYLNVNNPNGITVTDSEGYVIELEGEKNTLTTENTTEIIKINANSGFRITSVTNKMGADLRNYNRIELSEEMEINVTVEEVEVVYNSFTVNFEPDVFQSAYYQTGETNKVDLNPGGSNKITYDAAINPLYLIGATPINPESNIYVFKNAVSIASGQTTTVYYGRPYDGMVLDAYVNQPDSYSLTFMATTSVDGVDVAVNGISLNAWGAGSGNIILKGAELDITTPVHIDLALNGVVQKPSSSTSTANSYKFTVTSDMNFEMSLGDNYHNESEAPDPGNVGDTTGGNDNTGTETPDDSGDQTPDEGTGNETPDDSGDQTPDEGTGNETPDDSGDQTPDEGTGNETPDDSGEQTPDEGTGNETPDDSGDQTPGDNEGEDGENGVEIVTADTDQEVIIYTLKGVRVNSTNLEPGIYIINGKKHIIK